MTDFERERLAHYIVDAGDWLTQIEKILLTADTPSQVAAGDFVRVARKSIRAARRQLMIDGTIKESDE